MKEEIRDLALHRLARAEATLSDADLLLERGSLKSAVNRYYYAAFYAARALLATKEMDSSKHSGVISLFQKHFVKSGAIPRDVSKAFPRVFEARVDTDYEDFTVLEKAEADSIREQTAEFVESCKEAINRLLS